MSLARPSSDEAEIAAPTAVAEDAIAPIEHVPKWLLCIPIGIQLFWLGAKYGSVTLPSVLNPAIENGGLVGESKFSYLSVVGSDFRHLLPKTVRVAPSEDIEAARLGAALAWPLIAKPDIGWCGYGVRRIDDVDALKAYAAAFPPAGSILLQEFAPGPCEAGLHYIRAPDKTHGRIAALTIRHPPRVVGDGKSTVAELIATNARTRGKASSYEITLDPALLARRPATGESVVLTAVASTRVGGRYEDATHLVTPKLAAVVDDLCRSMGGFEHGRLDVRFASTADLRDGRFKIIEINGAGSEAIQYWDPRLSMSAAFAGVFAKQRELYALANQARRQGRRPVGLAAILRAHFMQQRLIRAYPPSN